MKISRRRSIVVSLAISAFALSLCSSDTFAQEPKKAKAQKKAQKKKQEAEIMANDPHPLIKNTLSETSLGVSTTLGSRQWDKSQQDLSSVKKFKSGMTAEFYGRQLMVFDPKRNSLRLTGNKIYGYLGAESKTNIGGGSGLDKTSSWKTSTTQTKFTLIGGAQLGDKFSALTSESGFILGGALIVDSDSGKKKDSSTNKKVTEYKDLTVDLQAQLGIGAFQFKDNLVKLMIPVGFRFKNEQEPDFEASKLKGATLGFGFESYQKIKTAKNKSIVLKANFDESQSWLTNAEGKSVNEFQGDMGLKVIFPIKKSPVQFFVRGAFCGRSEKDYDLNSSTPNKPIRSTSSVGGEIGTGVVF